MAQKSVGFTGADLNVGANVTLNETLNQTISPVEGGSAIDFIESVAVVTPDVVGSGWLTQLYAEHSWLAFDLFKVLLLTSVIMYVLKQVGTDFGPNDSALINLLKRSVVSTFMIGMGLPFIMTMLLINQEMTFAVAPGHVARDLLVAGVTSPFGCVMIIAYTIGIFAEGIFYLIRFNLIYISCIVWIYAWLLWTFERTARHGAFMLLIIIVNIFLGFAIAMIWSVGAACITHSSAMSVAGWGGDVAGLVVMLIALCTPIFVFLYVLWNPMPVVQKATYVFGKGV